MITVKTLATYAAVLVLSAVASAGEDLPLITGDDAASLQRQLRFAAEAAADRDLAFSQRIDDAVRRVGRSGAARKRFLLLQQAADAHCLLFVHINPESRVKVEAGPIPKRLVATRDNAFLVKVHNQAGVTAPLRVFSPQARGALPSSSTDSAWLTVAIEPGEGDREELCGKAIEYRLIMLRTDEVGDRAALVAMDVGQGTADIGFRNDTLLTFRCEPPE